MARTVKGGVSDFSRPALSLVACRGDNTKGNFKGKNKQMAHYILHFMIVIISACTCSIYLVGETKA